MVAVGWTGTWFADIAGKTDRSVTLASGMKYLDTYLYPQESIRTPSICLLFWKGRRPGWSDTTGSVGS